MEDKIKIVFMGTPVFALAPLVALINNDDFEVLSVITQEDKKIGRKQILTPPPVKTLAEKYDIPVLQPESLKNNQDFIDLLEELEPDFIIVVAYGQILPTSILEIPKYASVNIHGSLLPKYRGASPVEEALLKRDEETGISFIKMEKKLDAGPVYLLQRIRIEQLDNSPSLRDKLSVTAARLLPEVLKDIVDETIDPIPQNESEATYCHKINKEDGKIDLIKDTAEDINNKIRAYTPWPGCYLDLDGKKLKLLEIEIDTDSKESKYAKPNEIIELNENKIAIGTKKGLLIPITVQMEGKNPMEIQDFLRGNRSLLTKLLESPK